MLKSRWDLSSTPLLPLTVGFPLFFSPFFFFLNERFGVVYHHSNSGYVFFFGVLDNTLSLFHSVARVQVTHYYIPGSENVGIQSFE